jgi:hypothetical protein
LYPKLLPPVPKKIYPDVGDPTSDIVTLACDVTFAWNVVLPANLAVLDTFIDPDTDKVASGDPVLTPNLPAALMNNVLLWKFTFEVTFSTPPLITVLVPLMLTFVDVTPKVLTFKDTLAPENTTLEVIAKFAAVAIVPPRSDDGTAITLAENIPSRATLPVVDPPVELAAEVTTTVDNLSSA